MLPNTLLPSDWTNHHTNGLGMISELSQGYPGYDGMILPWRGFLSEILHEKGYISFAIGKWHLVPVEEGTMSGPFDRWPLGRGFDRFYGFLGAETDQFDPDLVYDNHSIEPVKTPDKQYHLTEDLTNKAIGFLRDLRVVDATKPFFLYFCPGANHAPHQVPEDWADKYRGQFDAGWDAYREQVYQRQLELGRHDRERPPQDGALRHRHRLHGAGDDAAGHGERLDPGATGLPAFLRVGLLRDAALDHPHSLPAHRPRLRPEGGAMTSPQRLASLDVFRGFAIAAWCW